MRKECCWQVLRSDNVNRNADELLQFVLHAAQIEQGDAWRRVYQQIEITSFGNIATQRRAKHPHTRQSVA